MTSTDEILIVNIVDSFEIDDIVLAEVATKEDFNDQLPSTAAIKNQQFFDEETTSSTFNEVAENNELSTELESKNKVVIDTIVTSWLDMGLLDFKLATPTPGTRAFASFLHLISFIVITIIASPHACCLCVCVYLCVYACACA